LGAGISLRSGEGDPAIRLDDIAGHALTFLVHGAKVVLGAGISLLGGSAIPLNRFGIKE
jgi:hypothetical protein